MRRWLTVEKEVKNDQFFQTSVPVGEVLADFFVEGPILNDPIILLKNLMRRNQSKDVTFVRAQGLDVDGENNPAPENMTV